MGVDLHYHVILIQLGKDGRDLALAESVVEGVVDRLWSDTEPGCGIAVDNQLGLEPARLLVAGSIPDLGQGLNFCKEPGRPGIQLVLVRIFQAVLELSPADAV